MQTFTVNEISKNLGVTEYTVRRWIRSGELPAVMNSKKEGYIVYKCDLVAFLSRHPKYGGECSIVGMVRDCLSNTISSIEQLSEAFQIFEAVYGITAYSANKDAFDSVVNTLKDCDMQLDMYGNTKEGLVYIRHRLKSTSQNICLM